MRAEALARHRRLVVGGIVREVFELLVGIAVEQRLVDGGHRAHVAEQNDFAGKLALIGVEIFLVWMLTHTASPVTGPAVAATTAWPAR